MRVFCRIEGGVVWNASRKRPIQVAHRLGKVDAVAHLVGDVLQLGPKAKAAQRFHPSIQGLDRAGRRCDHTINSGSRFE